MDLKTIVNVGNQEFTVSTVRLHPLVTNLPFETMIFRSVDGKISNYTDLYCKRYSSEQDAIQGHLQVSQGLRDGSLKV